MWETLSSIRPWARRHSRAVQCVTVAGGVAAAYLLYRKFSPVVSDLVASYKLFRQMERDIDTQRENERQEQLDYQFRQTRDAARLALGHISVDLRKKFDALFAVNVLKDRLRQKSEEGARSESRLDEFKVAVVSRSMSLLYAICLSCVALRLQLCIAARYAACADNHPRQDQINATFLGLIQHFNDRGSEAVASVISAAVAKLTSPYGMQSVIDHRTFEGLMADICCEIETELLSDCSRFLLPPSSETDFDPVLSQMRSELTQLLSSQSTNIVLKALFNRSLGSFQIVYDLFFGEGSNQTVCFGRTFARFADVFDRGMPSDMIEAETSVLLTSLVSVPELDEFSSIVFFPIQRRANNEPNCNNLV